MRTSAKILKHAFIVMCFTAPVSLHATTYKTLTLPAVNVNIGTWSDGSTYEPLFPGTHIWNGVPFSLTEDSAGHKVWIGNSPTLGLTAPTSLNIPAEVFGATAAYTIINTRTGLLDTNNGYVEFFGSEGGYYKVDLVQGVNVRDHFDDGWNNTINNKDAIAAFNIGPERARLDMQIYSLPESFSSQTLINIRFNPADAGAGGVPFIAAATVAAIPEPETYALMLAGLSLLCVTRRYRMTV
jgi:hypothetical protein